MKKFLIKIYTYKFFDDFVLIYPLYVVMFTDFRMSPWQVAFLLAVWSVTTFVLEVPSGMWADRYSRKKLLFAGQLIRSLGYACWLMFPNFYGFMFGFVLWGVKSALESGTFHALIFDELKNLGKDVEFTKVLGRTKTISFLAILIASLLASPAILAGYQFVLILSFISVLLSGVVITTVPDSKRLESTLDRSYATLLREGLTGAFNNPTVLRVILFLTLTLALGGALDEYWPIFASKAGLAHYGLGLFLGLISGFQAVACFVAHRFKKLADRFYYLLFIFGGVLLVVASYLFNVPSLSLLIIFSFAFAMIQVVYEGRLQHSISSSARATITSVSGFLTEIGVLVVYAGFGIMSQVFDYRISFMSYGLFVVGCGFLFLIFADNKSHNHKHPNRLERSL